MQIENDTLLDSNDVIQKLRDTGLKDLEQTKIQIKMNDVGTFFAAIDYGENDIIAFWEFPCHEFS
jgi:hypothetical protein